MDSKKPSGYETKAGYSQSENRFPPAREQDLEMAGSLADTVIGGGVALVPIGGVLMGVGTSEIAGTGESVWHNSWFLGGTTFVIISVACIIGALVTRFSFLRRPLDIKVVGDGQWDRIGDDAWAFVLWIRYHNRSKKPIILRKVVIKPDPGVEDSMEPELAAKVSAHEEALKKRYKDQIFTPGMEVPVGGEMVKCSVASSRVPVPERGRPGCTVLVQDSMDNSYMHQIAARPARTFRSREP